MAATLVGAALTAFVVLGGALAGDGSSMTDGAVAGLRIPAAAAASTSDPTAPTVASAPPSADASPPSLTATLATGSPAPATIPPTRVVVPRLGIDMAVEPQGVDGRGQMGLPPDPAVAGWYRFGSAPEDAQGAVVVAAHVDSKTLGVGPFARLGSARVGDEVRLDVADGHRLYRVTQVARVDKATLDADGLFSLAGPARLHLVTCTGDYVNGQGYDQNLVVVADRVDP